MLSLKYSNHADATFIGLSKEVKKMSYWRDLPLLDSLNKNDATSKKNFLKKYYHQNYILGNMKKK